MRGYVSALSAPKLGSTVEECEDAYSLLPETQPDELISDRSVFVAIADGASESLLARDWAKILATTMVRSTASVPETVRAGTSFAEAVLSAIDEWDRWLRDYLKARESSLSPIRWYEQPGLSRGAYSTLLAAHFSHLSDGVGEWHAGAVGDGCLFQIRNDSLICSFPATSSEEFGSSPALLNSKNRNSDLISLRVQLARGNYDSGDQFFLVTDALAAWFLKDVEINGRPWEILRDIGCGADPQQFEDWVEGERASGRMRNDDVTLIHVDLG